MNKELHHFFRNVMLYLRHYGWTLNLKDRNDCYCWINKKRIDAGLDYRGDPRQIILHEIAHIDTAKYCNQSHNPQFWKHLEYLTRKFLKTGLDEYQLNHKKYCSNGFYGLVYKRKE